MENFEITKRLVEVNGFNVMTYSIGSGEDILLLVHGGPGNPCNYLRDSHAHFSKFGYRVVTWDQLGCGESDKPNDPTLWTISRFVNELELIRTALNLKNIHLLGQSWGGVLGLEYCIKYQHNVKTFIAADTAFDLPRMQRGFERKKLALGEETYMMMAMREAEGTTDHPEYQSAVTLLMYRHMCRVEKWPDSVKYSIENVAHPVFDTMFGPYFFNCTGNIRDYNRINHLEKIKIPVLIVHGEHDYIIPEIACLARDYLPNAELVMMRECSHMPFYEKPEAYTKIIHDFLQRHCLQNNILDDLIFSANGAINTDSPRN